MIKEKDKQFIIETTRKFFPSAKIMVFGSRAIGKEKKYSDLDICLDIGMPMPLSDWSLLDEAFSNSDLLYKIDISDWHRITDDFKQIIINQHIIW